MSSALRRREPHAHGLEDVERRLLEAVELGRAAKARRERAHDGFDRRPGRLAGIVHGSRLFLMFRRRSTPGSSTNFALPRPPRGWRRERLSGVGDRGCKPASPPPTPRPIPASPFRPQAWGNALRRAREWPREATAESTAAEGAGPWRPRGARGVGEGSLTLEPTPRAPRGRSHASLGGLGRRPGGDGRRPGSGVGGAGALKTWGTRRGAAEP